MIVCAAPACNRIEQDESVEAASALDGGNADVRDSLKAIVVEAFAGMQAKDLGRALRHLSQDIVYIGDGLLITGKDSLTRMAERAFAEWRSVQAEVTVQSVDLISPDVAVMTWESQASATNKAGVQTPFGGITTAVFRNRGGRWEIIRQHQCAPMPPETEAGDKVLKQY